LCAHAIAVTGVHATLRVNSSRIFRQRSAQEGDDGSHRLSGH